ncbi:hypothetical protein SASPL_156424 [Salvia splendens]|uniref:laccase n=1 Tax=Salvia splendens TaxID=180675 RepID=A0A8X8VWR3_SALSN|nr:hypothetical protein SASPL_156424 [Salvia splendens]
MLIKVVNHVTYNMSIHWHGIRQLRTGWADGPAYITQCPIQAGESYVYNFTISEQRGTLLWHAHILWLRATIHGAIIILPKHGLPYPFPKPHKEEVLLLGEWWKSDVEAVIDEAMASGNAPNVSDAHTINGHPAPNSNCLGKGGYTLVVTPAKTYLLRIINAALNTELFFKIAGHNLTVVEVDATYVKPFAIDTILLAPGQTTNVLLTTDRLPARYQITASPFKSSPVTIDNSTATATLIYAGAPASAATVLADRPAQNATLIADTFTQSLRGLNSAAYPLAFDSTVQVVLQGTSMIFPENHPIHLHGSNFFAVGKGLGNFDPDSDPKRFNLVDPVERNTIAVPSGGWVAIRFRADNPGVWFLHCHLEVHTSWGLKMAFVVDNGKRPNESLLPPPNDLPKC